jgi:hypothetical protein
MSVKKSERSSLSRRLTNGGADAAKAATDLRARLDRPNLDADTQRSLVGVILYSAGKDSGHRSTSSATCNHSHNAFT